MVAVHLGTLTSLQARHVAVTLCWPFPRFGHTHFQIPSDMGIPCNPNPSLNPNC